MIRSKGFQRASSSEKTAIRQCRSCTSFAAWAAMTKDKAKQTGGTSAAAARNAPAVAPAVAPPDCPPDVDVLGRASWTLLHSVAASYPDAPSRAQQTDLAGFVKLFAKLYPCGACAEDFQTYLGKRVPRVQSRDEFGTWLCEAHNEVNRKLGKPDFDCSRWQERWRTGWRDGRCD
ncbi:hypothetical protein UVI_02021080 [Ustilaginoidea virens]|uniref:Sulfhydryl oxidase n=1 Tax=Ustilaginoidea virens TaxID=1159556 RepID=A0A1B5KXN6_USTVR|nr:hypothetical protein UVI_02021080 [Ustilaginoidea virens]